MVPQTLVNSCLQGGGRIWPGRAVPSLKDWTLGVLMCHIYGSSYVSRLQMFYAILLKVLPIFTGSQTLHVKFYKQTSYKKHFLNIKFLMELVSPSLDFF